MDDLNTEEAIALTQLLEMGFSIDKSKAAIAKCNGNIQQAIAEYLDQENHNKGGANVPSANLSISSYFNSTKDNTKRGDAAAMKKIFRKLDMLEENPSSSSSGSKEIILNSKMAPDNSTDSSLPPPLNPSYRGELDIDLKDIGGTIALPPGSSASTSSAIVEKVKYEDDNEQFNTALAVALSLSTEQIDSPNFAFAEGVEGTIALPPLHSSDSVINLSPSNYDYKESWDKLHFTEPEISGTELAAESVDLLQFDHQEPATKGELAAALAASFTMDFSEDSVDTFDSRKSHSSDLKSNNNDLLSSISEFVSVAAPEPEPEPQPQSHFSKSSIICDDNLDHATAAAATTATTTTTAETKSGTTTAITAAAATAIATTATATPAATEAVSIPDSPVWNEDPFLIFSAPPVQKSTSNTMSTTSAIESSTTSTDILNANSLNNASPVKGPHEIDNLLNLSTIPVHSTRERQPLRAHSPVHKMPAEEFQTNGKLSASEVEAAAFTYSDDSATTESAFFDPGDDGVRHLVQLEPSAPMLMEDVDTAILNDLPRHLIDNSHSFPSSISNSSATRTETGSAADSAAGYNSASEVSRNSLSIELQRFLRSIHRREYLPFTVRQESIGKWVGSISLKQSALPPGANSPQGNRPDTVAVTNGCTSRDICEQWCLTLVPPRWVNKKKVTTCLLCDNKFGIFSYGHHCRNCGYVICNNCSEKSWPSTMLSTYYHNNENNVRVCNDCHKLMVLFVKALKDGDEVTALAVYNTGNVNLHKPYTLFKNAAHPVREKLALRISGPLYSHPFSYFFSFLESNDYADTIT